jgi:hypothetical protein
MQVIKNLKLALKSLTSQSIELMDCYDVQGLDNSCTRLFDVSNFKYFKTLTAHVLNVQAFKTTTKYLLKNIYKYMIIQEKRKSKKCVAGIEMGCTREHLNDFKGLEDLERVHVQGESEKLNNINMLENRLCLRCVGT